MRPQIYIVETIGSGFLAVMAKPVSEWLGDELSGLAREGVRRLISLLESQESLELGLTHEEKICATNGIEFVSYPIPDRGVPDSVATFKELTLRTYHESAGGRSTVVHCRAGIGRSGLVAAGVLLHCGFGVPEAFAHVSRARRVSVPDTPQQEAWLHKNLRSIVG